MATAVAQYSGGTGEPVLQNQDFLKLKGPERAGILLLSLGVEHGRPIWDRLDEQEVWQISSAMSNLGTIRPQTLEALFVDFVAKMTSKGTLHGSYESTERILSAVLNPDRVAQIMEELRGPAGRNMWEKLSNVQENVLANYLKNEYPQTVALVLSKIRSEHAARVLSILPEEFAIEVVQRMLRMENVQKEVLEKVEQTLRLEFMSNLSHTRRRDAHELMAEIFNSFDRQTEARFLNALETGNREAAERIKALMFTFEDLGKLDAGSIQTLLRAVDKEKLALALKGASESLRTLFFSNLSTRAANLMRDDMEALGPVRLRDVDEAQAMMVNVAKDLAAKGEIMITKSKGDDELVY